MRRSRGALTAGIEVVLAALLVAAAGAGIWQLNRPLPEAAEVMVRSLPADAVVVDARGPLAYRRGHLPDARHLWSRDLLSFETTAGSLAPPESLAQRVRELGVQAGETVVVYDDGDGEEAALVLLVLRAFGLEAKLLVGGVPRWQSGGGPLSEEPEPEVEESVRPLEFDRRLVVDPDEALGHMAANEVAPLDVRERSDYLEGHLEGAVNVPARQLLPGGQAPRWPVLDGALAPARITHDTHPLVYGEGSAQAAVGWLALAAYGVDHVHVLAQPFTALEGHGFAITQTVTPAATSTRTSSVCWR